MPVRTGGEYIEPIIAIPFFLLAIFLTFYRYLIFDYYFSNGFVKLILFGQITNLKLTFLPRDSIIIDGDTKHSRTFRTLNLMNRARYKTLLIDKKVGVLRYLVLTPKNHHEFISELQNYLIK